MSNARWFAALLLAGALILGTAGCSSDEQNPADSASSSSRLPSSANAELIESPDEPEPAPDVTMETMDGETIALADRPGEVLLVNFWATWCAPCRKEIPDLIDLQDDFGPDGLTVVGVSLDQQGADAVTPFLEDYAINYPIVIDTEGTIEQAFGGVYGLPMTYVVGPDSRIHHRVLGLFPVDEMRPKLTALLDDAAD